MKPRTLIDKVWDRHVVHAEPGRPGLLYIDVHLVHEVTSPQAFEGLRMAGRGLHRSDRTFATVDHAIPTTSRQLPVDDPIALRQVQANDLGLAASNSLAAVEVGDRQVEIAVNGIGQRAGNTLC